MSALYRNWCSTHAPDLGSAAMHTIAAIARLYQAAEGGSSGISGTLAVIGLAVSVAALTLAWWSARSAHLSVLAGRHQAAMAWQQMADRDPSAGPVFVLGKPRWRGRSVRIPIEHVAGPALAEVKTDIFMVDPKSGRDHARKPSLENRPGGEDQEVWRYSAPGASNRLELNIDAERPPVRPRRAVVVLVKLECDELDGPRTWRRLMAAVLTPPTFW